MSARAPADPATEATPLAPVLAFTALSSFAAGTATLAIFFVTARPPYAFGTARQYALGLVVGLGYTLGALAASALRRAVRARGGSARALLATLVLALALLLTLPLVLRSSRALFGLLALYAPLTGAFWPLVEAYVSGGRRGAELRSAVGRFNVTWSLTLLGSFFAPPLFARPELVFALLAATHVLSLGLVRAFRREPGVHVAEEHQAPAAHAELLRVHRVLHAMSYLVMYALAPTLPRLLARLELGPFAASALGATWLAARTFGFLVLERWHGWHGRPALPALGALAVLGGFGATLLAPALGPRAVPLVALALVVFGAGLAALYAAALYYAFEVGGDEGGGSHEALIGLGYTLGPAAGLAALALERAELVGEGHSDAALLTLVALLCAGALLVAWRARGGSSGAA